MMIDLIYWLQSFSTPPLDTFFLIISALTGEAVYFMVFGLLYWCYDKKAGYMLGVTVMFSFSVNTGLKYFFKMPRPFEYSNVRKIDIATGYGYSFPSAHAQVSSTLAVSFSMWLKKNVCYIASGVLIVLTCLSRIYLGVHTIVDVGAGVAVGVAISILGYFIMKNIKYKMAISIAGVVISYVVLFITKDADVAKMTGIMTGFVIGNFIEEKFIDFNCAISLKKRILRLITGLVAILIIKFCIGFIPCGELLEYMLLGLSITTIIPFLFISINFLH